MNLIEILKKTPIGRNIIISENDDKVLIQKKQSRLLKFIILFTSCTLLSSIVIYNQITAPKKKAIVEEEDIKIKTSNEVLNQDKIWSEYFENALKKESEIREKEKSELLETLKNLKEEINASNLEAIERVKSETDYETTRLKDLVFKNTQENPQENYAEEFSVIDINNDIEKNTENFIPAGSFAPARLLAGISVPTGVTVQSDPFPVIIQITDKAITPNDETIDLKNCRVIGSCYGNISNERAIVRLETLSCVDVKTKKVNETKIAGYLVGADGLPGIRGTVISMDKKHIQNAFLGGFISGLARTASEKSDSGISLNLNNQLKPQKFKDKLQDNSLSSLGEGSEKIANYFIKKAESIQEVIEVPIGASVSVVFSSGVYNHATDTKERIESDRQRSISETKKNINENKKNGKIFNEE
jgi:conjugal transfer pilus assembly protein TraB